MKPTPMKAIKRIADLSIQRYKKMVLDNPVSVIICLLLVIALLGYKALDFKIDASTETLLLENDEDLNYSRKVWERYGVVDFLVISYTPRSGGLLDQENLDHLGRLRDELAKIERVASVLTILDVPLLESPPIEYSQFSGSLPTLSSPRTEKELARLELQTSDFYNNLIVSPDMRTTALMVNLRDDASYRELIRKRDALQEERSRGKLSPAAKAELKSVIAGIRGHLDGKGAQRHEMIVSVRATMDRFRDRADIFLGGISMIADDMITYIKSDLRIFGLGVFILLVGMLGMIFRSIRWVVLPMLCCFLSVIAMMGVLGAFGLEVTVISSNFISLQLIITMAIAVHLMVRYRELQTTRPDLDQRSLVLNTVRSKFIPCLYAVLTTIAGFSSLLLCDIKPVIHFGWMMSAGILLSLLLTFILFPSGIVLLEKPETPAKSKTGRLFIDALGRYTEKHGGSILAAAIILTLISVMGVSRLVVENSFIDYFKKSTEIYQGMKVIDQKLGGTTPLNVVVRFDALDPGEFEDEDDFFFEDQDAPLDGQTQEEDLNKYWFTDDRMEVVEQVHDYLDGLPATGKVLSLGTLLKIGRRLNKGKSLDSIEMAVLYTKLPNEFKKLILTPYISIDNNEARYSIRIIDSLPGLKRNALLKQIQSELVTKLGLEKDKIRLAGTMVLYNNMLQSLFSSQIKTLGIVSLALMVMFLALFRSLKVALIALFPNLLSAGAVLGVMGWLNIPLDMMTITIAAISIGIAVDNTIHYIYRFKEEIRIDGDYHQAMHRCHRSIGHAMFYTSITIIIGFSILVFSNFWPTIYFGLFTGLAMFIALIASLTLLPQLLIMSKPYGPAK